MQLYKIAEQMTELANLEGEIDHEAIADTMEALEMEFDDKAAQCGYLIKNLSAAAAACKAEAKRLSDKAKSHENTVASIKDYLRSQMNVIGKTKTDHAVMPVSIRKGREMVQVLNEDKVPDQFKQRKTVVTLNKAAMLAAGKEDDFDGFEVVRGKSSVIVG